MMLQKLYNITRLYTILNANYFRNLQITPISSFYKGFFARRSQRKLLYKPNLLLTYKNVLIHRRLHTSRLKILAITILGWLGFDKTDEEKESELIMTLKRAVLSEQREEYNKAEQLLHVALRLAQQQQNQQGILYCYDLMANLAFNQLQLEKSEKLFVNVMQMLLSNGVPQDDLKVIHISLKLARICHLKAEGDRAELGYKWCLEKIEKQKNDDIDAQTLYGVIQDWYAQFLLDRGDVKTSLIHLKEAYKTCCDLRGRKDSQSMLLLNDLGITCWRAGDLESAEDFLKQAIEIGSTMEDQSYVGIFLANLGLIYLQKGMFDIAKKYCKDAWTIGRKFNNTETVEQANYCFEQVELHQ
ncbi:Tetratricopeptide repeat-containing protein, partial [Oryctes borbonicus]